MEFYESVQGYIATECPICGTRLILRPEQAGGTLKCEMCGHRLAIPKEIHVRPKPKPVQHDIEPYAVREEAPPVWTEGGDESQGSSGALPSGRADERVRPASQGPRSRGYDVVPSDDPPRADARKPAASPTPTASPMPADKPAPSNSARSNEPVEPPPRRKEALAVVCPKCQNRMYARLHQVGQQIACGDCGYVMVVPQPPAEAPQKALPRPDPVALSAEEPPERPRDYELIRATRVPTAPWLPDPPRWTFFSGVVSFLWVGAVPLYCVTISVVLMVVGLPAAAIYQALAAGSPYLLFVVVLLAGFVVIIAPFAAGCFWKVIHATANGAVDIVDWPDEPWADHVGVLWRVIYHGALSLGLPYGAGLAAAHWFGPVALPVVTCVGALLMFPFLTISSLESQRTTWPFSSVVNASLVTLWWGWLLMYAEVAVLMAIWGAAVVFTFDSSPYLTVLWGSPILAAVALISARLFGRLIWRVTARDLDEEPRRPTVYERVVRSGE